MQHRNSFLLKRVNKIILITHYNYVEIHERYIFHSY